MGGVVRILAVSDEESELLCARLCANRLGPVDAVISCGDLRPSYLDFVATCANAPLYFVRGNHDTDEEAFRAMGGTPLDLKVVRMAGLRVGGLDGSVLYREGICGYTQAQMARRAASLWAKARLMLGLDVLVTHAPPKGHGDLGDPCHSGFACYNWLLGSLRPRLMLSGHVHLNYDRLARERLHPSKTLLVNACGFWYGSVEMTGSGQDVCRHPK